MGDGLRRDVTVMTEPEVAALSLVCGLLNQPARLRIVLFLCGGERRVADLVALLGTPQPTVSHHLGLLRRAGLLTSRRAGQSTYYGLSKRLTVDADGRELRIANAWGTTVHISTGGRAS